MKPAKSATPSAPGQTRSLLEGKTFDLMRHRRPLSRISFALIAISLLFLAFRGLNLGIDFTGGYIIEVAFPQSIENELVADALDAEGFEGARVQKVDSSRQLLIRLPPAEDGGDISKRVLATVNNLGQGKVEVRRIDFVGPQFGRELAEQGITALLAALFCIIVYVWLRFEKKLSLGSVAALAHDTIVVVGFFAVTGLSFDISVLAALLAVVGYSLNDTIVVYDRIRENFRQSRGASPENIINRSVNQTLSRTIITSLTTLIVLVALALFGGEAMRGFALALIVGVAVGTYSSIFVASSLALALGVKRTDMILVERR